jgi:V-type H+-transporting ATPase subunit C
MADHFYWLISAPKTPQDTFQTVNRKTAKEHNYATNFKFEVPDLKVGTLDSLMMLSDDLAKIDTFVENTTKKIVRQLTDIDKKPEKGESLTVNGTAIDAYLTHFNWDEAKYPMRSPLKELTDKIHQQVAKLDDELKVKSADYQNISHTIAAEERKLGGNLLVRSLADTVKATDITETEYLTTLLVVVPKYLYKDWYANYETLTQYILPRSSKVLAEDAEYGLFTVTLFKKCAEDYKNIAREKRFTVRDFKLDEESKSGKEERNKLITEKDRQKRNLTRWCKTNFAEAFVAWAHLKAIRVFVESVLRYGLPVNFQAILMQPHKKEDKGLRTVLADMFKHLASVHVISSKEDDAEKFYPYVYIPIDFTEM